MVSALLKSTLREIRQSLGRYLAIFAIVGLGVSFLAGLRMSQPAMLATGVDYLAEYAFHDFRLLSTLGFTEEDVEAFAALEGVDQAAGSLYTEFLWRTEEEEDAVLVAHALTPGINEPNLTAGRMPEHGGECLGDVNWFTEEDLGKPLRVSPHNDEDTLELLAREEYTLVGLADTPLYLNFERGTASIGSGSVTAFVLIPREGFESETYYEIYLRMENTADAYSDAYQEQREGWEPAVEELLEERAALRYDTLYADAMEELADAEAELADGWAEYRAERADAEEELADAHADLLEGEEELADGQADYEQGQLDYADGLRELAEGEQELSDAEAELADAEREIADGEQELADARAELADARAELAEGKAELADGWAEYIKGRTEAEEELADAYQQLMDAEAEYADGLAEYEDGLRELEEAEQELADGEEQLAEGWAELEKSEEELDEAGEQMADAGEQLDAVKAQLDQAKVQLDQGEAAYGQLTQLYQGGQALVAGFAQFGVTSVDELLAVAGQNPVLEAGLNTALQQQGSSLAEFSAGWAAAEAQLGAPLSQETLDGLRAQLDGSRAQYEAGLAQYREGRAEYEDGLAQYEEGLEAFREGRQELRDAQRELEEAREQLEEGYAELADAKAQLEDARAELDDGWKEYYEGEEEARREFLEAEEELLDAERELHEGEEELRDGEAELADAEQELADARAELEEGRAELADGWAELADARAELADAKADLDSVPGELADARTELDDGWAEYYDGLAEAESEFADAEEELADAEAEIADAYLELEDLKPADTYALTRGENTGYASFDNDTAIIAAISVVFPIFFFLVAALVCMTTMKRMVDEQRTQIGVLKALGYRRGQIMGKYLFYAGSAAITGGVLGYALGSWGLPLVIWEIYAIMYGFAPLKYVFDPVLALISLAAALLCSMGATWLSCRLELVRPAASLMRPKTPKAGKRVFLEHVKPLWRRLGFLRKVSVRNVLRYRSRLVMMVLGIGGCTALLITGFGIRDSISSVVDSQFEEITLFDYAVNFQDPLTQEEAGGLLRELGWESGAGLLVHSGSTDAVSPTQTKSAYLVVPAGDSLEGFISLHSGERAIPFPGPGQVVLNTGLAEDLGVGAGDALQLRDSDWGSVEVTVADICDNYIFNYVFVSPETYRQQLGSAPAFKTLYVLAREGADPYGEGVLLAEGEGVSSVTINAADRARVSGMLERLDIIVVVVVLFAAALAFIVLYNLTNINITERVREIATIKVLGFYPRETAAYVFREINMLSATGSVAGLLLGKALHAYVMLQIQVDGMFFPSQVKPLSYVIAVALTLLFTSLITHAMRPRLRRIDMAESLKSIE